MTEPRDNKRLVAIVADSLIRRAPEASVIDSLVEAGVPQRDAPVMYRDIKAACQQGVQAVVTHGLSAPNGPPSDPLLAEAFRVGQAKMRRAAGLPGRRVAVILFIALGAAAVLWTLIR